MVIVRDSYKLFIFFSRRDHPANSRRVIINDEIRELTLSHSCNYSITDCLGFLGIIPVYYRGNSLLRLIYDRFNHPPGFFLSPPLALRHVYLRSGVYDAVDLVHVPRSCLIFSWLVCTNFHGEQTHELNQFVAGLRSLRAYQFAYIYIFALLCEFI